MRQGTTEISQQAGAPCSQTHSPAALRGSTANGEVRSRKCGCTVSCPLRGNSRTQLLGVTGEHLETLWGFLPPSLMPLLGWPPS